MTGGDDHSAYLRGKLRLAGVDGGTPVGELCDVLTVLLSDGVPADALTKLRRSVDRAAWKIKPPDRSGWGLRPDQVEGMRRLTGN